MFPNLGEAFGDIGDGFLRWLGACSCIYRGCVAARQQTDRQETIKQTLSFDILIKRD